MTDPGALARTYMSIQSALSNLREKVYPEVRNKFARTALDLGGASTGADAKKLLHEGGNYALTKKLREAGLPTPVAMNLSDAAYLGNEAFTGTLAKLTGRPFFSDYGFRWKDVGMNRQGQERAAKEFAAIDEAEQEARRGWRGIPRAGR